jgi:3-isopropylmalate/(R)-2-methylmalate dehydratase small subunit
MLQAVNVVGGFALEGNAWVFGDQLEADAHICSLDTLDELKRRGVPLTAQTLGKHCLETVDPEFSRRVARGDFIVAGQNIGYSACCLDGDPDDPHFIGAASLAIKGAGVAGVLCESSGMNFLMNSINRGLPVVECPGVRSKVKQGDRLRLDLETGTVMNLISGEVLRFSPFPETMLYILRRGGLYEHLAIQLSR